MTPTRPKNCASSASGWVEEQVEIPNPQGVHVRPAQLIVENAGQFASDVTIRLGEKELNAKSIMQLLTLLAGKGDVLTIRARGGDARQAVEALVTLVTDGFGEM
jgi:phosphocarrier protein HPr